MANTYSNPVINGGKYAIVAGSFAPAAAAAPTTVRGKGFSVARGGTGNFVLTFDQLYKNLISATATLQLATAADQFCVVESYVAASKTLDINVWDVSDAAVADVAANANNRVNFICVFELY
jgi:hypothetical protein